MSSATQQTEPAFELSRHLREVSEGPGGAQLIIAGAGGEYYAGVQRGLTQSLLEAVLTFLAADRYQVITVFTTGGDHLPPLKIAPFDLQISPAVWHYRAPPAASTAASAAPVDLDPYAPNPSSDEAGGASAVLEKDVGDFWERLATCVEVVEELAGYRFVNQNHLPTESKPVRALALIDESWLEPDNEDLTRVVIQPDSQFRSRSLAQRFRELAKRLKGSPADVVLLARDKQRASALRNGTFFTAPEPRPGYPIIQQQLLPKLQWAEATQLEAPSVTTFSHWRDFLPEGDNQRLYDALRRTPPRLAKRSSNVNPWTTDELRKRVLNGRTELEKDIKGQPRAIEQAIEAMKRIVLGLGRSDPRVTKPRGLLFLAGPTGTGKTALTEHLSRLIFPERAKDEAWFKQDMGSLASEADVNRMIGSAKGYIGSEEDSALFAHVKKFPQSVILFDEIEKAHPKIWDQFLSLLNDGVMTDGKGKSVYFTDCLIVFTSNIGYSVKDDPHPVNRDVPYEEVPGIIKRKLSDYFNKLGRNELAGRGILQNLVVYDFLSQEVLRDILQRALRIKLDQIEREQGVRVTLSERAFITLLKQATLSPEFGARYIEGEVEKLEGALADRLLDGNVAGQHWNIVSLEPPTAKNPSYTLSIQVT